MNVDQLWDRIVAAGREHDYVVHGAQRHGLMASNVFVIAPAGDGTERWVKFFTERGEICEERYYVDESAVCRAVIRELNRVPKPPVRLTAQEIARAERISAADEQIRRQLIIDAGYDPDTLAPFGK